MSPCLSLSARIIIITVWNSEHNISFTESDTVSATPLVLHHQGYFNALSAPSLWSCTPVDKFLAGICYSNNPSPCQSSILILFVFFQNLIFVICSVDLSAKWKPNWSSYIQTLISAPRGAMLNLAVIECTRLFKCFAFHLFVNRIKEIIRSEGVTLSPKLRIVGMEMATGR